MKKYEDRYEPATFYFVIHESPKGKRVVAWTDNKKLLDAYLEFHKCKDLKVKVVKDSIKMLQDHLDQNNMDEIGIMNFPTKSSKRKHDVEDILVPVTESEVRCVKAEADNYMMGMISYCDLNEMLPYLKNKYQQAFKDILLTDIILKNIHSQTPKKLNGIKMDWLKILLWMYSDIFGM